MSNHQIEPEEISISRLTSAQRALIYEAEKRRLDMAAPRVPEKLKVAVIVYLIGCALQYFGVAGAALDLWSEHHWKLQPEPTLFITLLDSVITLLRPFLAVVLTFWFLGAPVLVVLGWWLWVKDIKKFFKNKTTF